VTLRRSGSRDELTAVSDCEGTVTFERLLPGEHEVSALRLLTEEERGQLPEAEREVNAFAGGRTLRVRAPATEATLLLGAGRPGSLVISEWSFKRAWSAATGSYSFGGFLELYNNTDTTIYLDGKLIGSGVTGAFDYPKWPCTAYERFTNDPDGVWNYYLFQFPGSGGQYPLSPGETAVIATDAIDHTQYAEGTLDLSGADFEFIDSGDPDNPRAPNLVSVGPRPCCLGHGLSYSTLDAVALVADPVDLSQVPRDFTLPGPEVWRVPAAAVLDVATFRAEGEFSYPPCKQMVHPRFDRQPAPVPRGYVLISNQRAVVAILPGRKVLQRTLTSSRDFLLAAPTPSRLP